MRSLFPHQKLDWTISRLEESTAKSPEDPALRLELARGLLSRGLFHHGGEAECNRALGVARKVLQDDPVSAEALVIAGFGLVGMERPEAASKYLDQAVRIDAERPDLRLAMGALERQNGDVGAAVRQFESACRLAPEAWETHLFLGRALAELARQRGNPRRLVERSQYHLVRALELEPTPDVSPSLFKDLGISCMLTGRYKEAEKFFVRLREHDRFAPISRYYLGQVAYELGKYNNAIQHYRQYLRDRPDDPKVVSRMAMAWFQLGEYSRAREACHQALLLDPENLTARHALGCTLLEEGDPGEAIRVFRETLKEHPEHMPSFIELARTRRLGGDVAWLVKALDAEVGQFDRLPQGGNRDGRKLTRERIGVILDELRAVGPSTTGAVLNAIDLTQDEGLRFQLWEAACGMGLGAVADSAAARLRDPGKHYGPELAGEAVAAASALPEPVLTGGLGVDEADLRRAAVDRYPPAPDVRAHRRNLDLERNRARAHQALLLLAIASRRSSAGKELLRSWAESADPELSVAAWTGLAMYGEPDAVRRLGERARERGASRHVDRLMGQVTPPAGRHPPRRVSDDEALRCSTCGRGPHEVHHLMAGSQAVICDLCVVHVGQHRRSMAASDEAVCNLCGATPFESRGIYHHNGVNICSGCLELSLGLLEREEVDKFLTAW